MPEISNEEFNRIKQALDKAIESEKRNQRFLSSVGPSIVQMLQPTLNSITEAIRGTKIDTPVIPPIPPVQVQQPKVKVVQLEPKPVQVKQPKVKIVKVKPDPVEVKLDPIKVPTPKVTVNMPTKAMTNEMRAIKKAISEQVATFQPDIFEEVSFTKPLPVILVDANGKPYIPGQFSGGVTRGGEVTHKTTKVGRYAAVDVATSATEIVPAKEDRRSVVLTHEDDDPIYVGYDDSLTTSNGTPVVANQGLTFDNYTGAVYGIISTGASSSTISLRYLEV